MRTILMGQVRNMISMALLLSASPSYPVNAYLMLRDKIVVRVVLLAVPRSNLAVCNVSHWRQRLKFGLRYLRCASLVWTRVVELLLISWWWSCGGRSVSGLVFERLLSSLWRAKALLWLLIYLNILVIVPEATCSALAIWCLLARHWHLSWKLLERCSWSAARGQWILEVGWCFSLERISL